MSDLINTQDAIKNAYYDGYDDGYNAGFEAGQRDVMLDKLPTAQSVATDIDVLSNGLISRKAAINALGERPTVWMDDDEYSLGQRNQYDCDKLAIEAVPSVTPKHHWIPCSERLPYAEYGESDTVLATCGYWEVEDESIRWIRMLYYDGGNWCYLTGEAYLGKVYAWMPLPEPYLEEGGE